jgi:putative membrane protein
MMLLVQLVVVAVVLMLASQSIPGVYVRDWMAAFVASIVFALLAVFIGWVIKLGITLLTLPLTIVTLGLFLLLISWIANAVLLKMTAGLVESFAVRDWRAALTLSFLYSAALFVVELVMR